MTAVDLLVIGAGPAGMSAAIATRDHGLSVMVVDDQPTPGGQIWRAIEGATTNDPILGPSYVEGRPVAEQFRASGILYRPGCQLWKIEPGYRAFVSQDGTASIIDAATIILATGAQERPVPFRGWTLPGVLTVGAAQIQLKSAGQIPDGPVWIAGTGPLTLLYAQQLLRAGGQIAGFLDTAPAGQWKKAIRHLPKALRAADYMLKGLGWQASLRSGSVPMTNAVDEVEAVGDTRIRKIRYRKAGGTWLEFPASTLLVHEGVVPSIHVPLSQNCKMRWDDAQDCFVPCVDAWGESSEENLFIAGDGAGIAGAKAAKLRGQLAGLRVAAKLGRIAEQDLAQKTKSMRAQLAKELSIRPFLDALYRPRRRIFEPSDAVLACRCEEITAGRVREIAAIGRPGPNQLKAATRAGMGPCQGRQCGYTITRLIAEVQQRPAAEVGFYNVRAPLKPVTLEELASLHGRIPA